MVQAWLVIRDEVLQQGAVWEQMVDFDCQRVLVLTDLNISARFWLCVALDGLLDEHRKPDAGLVCFSKLVLHNRLRFGAVILIVLNVLAEKRKSGRLEGLVGLVVLFEHKHVPAGLGAGHNEMALHVLDTFDQLLELPSGHAAFQWHNSFILSKL